jgi:hypothetical protein
MSVGSDPIRPRVADTTRGEDASAALAVASRCPLPRDTGAVAVSVGADVADRGEGDSSSAGLMVGSGDGCCFVAGMKIFISAG